MGKEWCYSAQESFLFFLGLQIVYSCDSGKERVFTCLRTFFDTSNQTMPRQLIDIMNRGSKSDEDRVKRYKPSEEDDTKLSPVLGRDTYSPHFGRDIFPSPNHKDRDPDFHIPRDMLMSDTNVQRKSKIFIKYLHLDNTHINKGLLFGRMDRVPYLSDLPHHQEMFLHRMTRDAAYSTKYKTRTNDPPWCS